MIDEALASWQHIIAQNLRFFMHCTGVEPRLNPDTGWIEPTFIYDDESFDMALGAAPVPPETGETT